MNVKLFVFIEKKIFKVLFKFCKTILYYTCKLIENTDMAEEVRYIRRKR